MRKLKISYDPELEAKIEDLVMRAKNGDNEAFEELSDHYMSLIEIYANFFGHKTEIPKEDLVNYGRIGLSIAVKEFETTMTCNFSSFATSVIADNIMKGVDEWQVKRDAEKEDFEG